MRVLAVTVLCLLLVVTLQQMTFEQFTINFNRHYANEQEFNYRKGVFQECLKRIAQVNAQNLGYTLGVTENCDKTDAELLSSLKFQIDTETPASDINQEVFKLKASSTPSFQSGVNWNVSGYVSTPQQQGTCSSCWAFTTASAMETSLFIMTGQKTVLSKQYFVSCTKYNGCGGGIQLYATKNALTGVPEQSAYPYISAKAGSVTPNISGMCSSSNKINFPAGVTYKRYKKISYSKMRDLVSRGPVMSTFAVGTQFFSYKNGTFMCRPLTKLSMINHAVTIVGFTETNGTDGGHWILKNSWGTAWGIGGFAYLSKYRDCGIKYDVFQFVDNSTVAAVHSSGFRMALLGILLLISVISL